jgi:hypothetical protein
MTHGSVLNTILRLEFTALILPILISQAPGSSNPMASIVLGALGIVFSFWLVAVGHACQHGCAVATRQWPLICFKWAKHGLFALVARIRLSSMVAGLAAILLASGAIVLVILMVDILNEQLAGHDLGGYVFLSMLGVLVSFPFFRWVRRISWQQRDVRIIKSLASPLDVNALIKSFDQLKTSHGLAFLLGLVGREGVRVAPDVVGTLADLGAAIESARVEPDHMVQSVGNGPAFTAWLEKQEGRLPSYFLKMRDSLIDEISRKVSDIELARLAQRGPASLAMPQESISKSREKDTTAPA